VTGFIDVFGSDTVPAAQDSYSSISLTADATLQWPYNYSGTDNTVSEILEVTTTAGLSITLPAANQVSAGEEFVIRNIGANTFTIKDNAGSTIATLAAGYALSLYVKTNTTAAGTWGQFAYGVGSATLSAGSIEGYGLATIGATLNQECEQVDTSSNITVDSTYRSKVINYSGGSGTFTLTAAATLGAGFFCFVKNNGTGTLIIDPNGSETIDGTASFDIQPSESLILVCNGTNWITIAYGRSVEFNFSQLTKDVSAGGTINLTSAEASNDLLTFIGNPAADVTITVPAIVKSYYVFNNLSTAYSILIKTISGATVNTVSQSSRTLLFCDGTELYSAVSISAATTVQLVNGSEANPALAFASQTNTGIYKYGTGMAVTVGGSAKMLIESSRTTMLNGISGGTF